MTKIDVYKQQLYKALLLLQKEQDVARFLYDLATPGEIENLAGRLEVAKRLDNGESQRMVSAETGVSIATVTRVNRFLKQGKGGYTRAIKLLKNSSPNNHSRSHT